MKKFYSLRSSVAVLATCTFIFLTLTSSDNGGSGVNNAAQNGAGCGSCHGNTANMATTISLTGAPGTGYMPGTSYPMTLTISNPTMPKCGFDLYVTGGTLAGNPSGTTLTPVSFNQIRHNTPLALSGGAYVCNFNWTAPAAGGLVTFKVVANAVNGNGQDDNADQWNTAQFPIAQAPNNVNDIQSATCSVYPNPATSSLSLTTNSNAPISSLLVSNIAGQIIQLPYEIQLGKVEWQISSLSAGLYQISFVQNGKMHHASFVKK